MQNFKYRITLGYYAHFSSSSVNDPIMSFRNPRFYSKLDKQVLASAELEFLLPDEKKIKLNSSFMSYYGWDIPPFIGSIIHFESYLYAARAHLNIFSGLTFILKSDGSFNEINGMTGIPPSKFLIMENSILSKWNIFSSDKLNFTIIPEVNLHSIRNRMIDAVPEQQNFFSEEFDKVSFGISGAAGCNFSESLTGNINLRFDRHFSKKSAFSLSAEAAKKLSQYTKIIFSAASVARFPKSADLFGKFTIYEASELDTNLFTIEGNSNLREERLNHLGIEFNASAGYLDLSAEIFYKEILNPILQKNLSAKRTNNPGDILRSAVSTNGEGKSSIGLIFSSMYNFIEPLIMNFSYRYINNDKKKFFPRHKAAASMEYKFSSSGSMFLKWFYRGSSTAEEYIVSGENDLLLNSGFGGNQPENSYLDFTIEQGIGPFYFFNTLSFRFTIDNIFNRRIKFFPIGNESRRTLIFFVSGKI